MRIDSRSLVHALSRVPQHGSARLRTRSALAASAAAIAMVPGAGAARTPAGDAATPADADRRKR